MKIDSLIRLLAGTFVLLGVALAHFVNPWWLLLPVFVGANLIQSVFTGSRAQWKQFLADANGREILLYRASGGRSGMAARLLVAEGVRAANTGGLADWLDAGWPVAKPAKARPGAMKKDPSG